MIASSASSGYVPVSDWPSLTELGVGFGDHLMPKSSKLIGKYFDHTFAEGFRISHHLVDGETLTWKMLDAGDQTGLTGDVKYDAFEVRPDLFLINFHKPDYEEYVSMVADISTGQAVVALSGFNDKGGEKRTWTTFFHAVKSGESQVTPYEPTGELVGKHILYQYTARDAYEHVYLNKGTLTWHCLAGTEKGLADTELCKVLKLGDNVYLLFWTETIMPVESVVVVDLDKMRSTGRFFCWDPKPQKNINMMFGSYATLLGETDAEEVLQKPIQPRI